jgi:phytoene/squalene synthetase
VKGGDVRAASPAGRLRPPLPNDRHDGWYPLKHFWLRRPYLLARSVLANRERPDLAQLGGITDPEQFVWAILPHAARTFSACIVLLPRRAALPAAVAYLYCRMLDTYEDLVPDRAEREGSLLSFAARFDLVDGRDGTLSAAPAIARAEPRDQRDRAHLLLVERATVVDRVFMTLDETTRRVIADLVRDMAAGMRWSSATFAAQGGGLKDQEQLALYCRHVLGNPVVFGMKLVRLGRGLDPTLSPDEREHAMRVGEMVQLANVTRDVERDLHRGIAYDPALRPALAGAIDAADVRTETIRTVRERLLRMALSRAPSYARVVEAMRLPRVSLARASAVVMLLFTERHFRGSAIRAGLATWSGPDSAAMILARGLLSAASRKRADREIERVERAFQLVSSVSG